MEIPAQKPFWAAGFSVPRVHSIEDSVLCITIQVDAWLTASPALEPKRLLPALLRYAAKDAPRACRTHTLRYLDFCLRHLLSEDPAIHQLAVSPLPQGIASMGHAVLCMLSGFNMCCLLLWKM